MHWLALHLPQLSLEAFAATLTQADRSAPLALVQQHRVVAVNAAAAAAGVRTGLKRATALALAPALRLAQAEPARDRAALQAVAHVALAFTPMVVMDDDPATVLLELASVLRYHGGPVRLRSRLFEALAPLGHRLQVATAPTPAGAALLARWGTAAHGDAGARRTWGAKSENRPRRADFLPDSPPHSPAMGQEDGEKAAAAADLQPATPKSDSLLDALRTQLDAAPVWLLGPGREHWDALQSMGLHTLADLRALPRAGLARRFGESLLHALDRARGDAPDPRQPLEPPAVFDSALELYARADTTDQLLHGAVVLLARLIAWAQARRARVAAFTLRMRHERSRRHDTGNADAAANGDADAAVPAHTTLTVELAEPGIDATQLQLLLRERLARCTLPAPTLELSLHCHRWVQAEAPSGELFPSRQSQREGLQRLLERLRARLGDEGVLRLQPLADHRPEHAQHLRAATTTITSTITSTIANPHSNTRHAGPPAARSAEAAPPPAGGALPLHRPAWLLPEPLPLHERGALPLLGGRPLQILSGPERIEAGWWDADLAARDYFIARDHAGALVWIYRTRLAAPGGWFLQGRFG